MGRSEHKVEKLFGVERAPRHIRFARSSYERLSLPFAIFFLLGGARIHPSYELSWRRRFRLGWRIYRNTQRLVTLTSYRAHLAMAAKLLELSPRVSGAVVECGCYLGGATANLSLVCEIVNRELIVYDSFEGLPKAEADDKYASEAGEGFLRADLDVVKDNVRRFGVIERCTFRKGWFEDTLPHHDTPIALCFLDVDYQASLHTCVKELWPHIADKGYLFIDEYVFLDYCALFFSEKWWRTYLDCDPPGLAGVGTGVAVGHYYLGPYPGDPLHAAASVAYTRKGVKQFSGLWGYFPEGEEPES